MKKVTATLRDAGLSECFSLLLGGEEGLEKSAQITHVRGSLGFSAEETIMVGDTLGDVHMAKRAGVRSIAVLWGYQGRATLSEEAPDHFIESPKDLLTLVESMNSTKGASSK